VPDQDRTDKSLPSMASELWELILAYARQETIEPIKGLGRFIMFGLAGSLVIGIGLVLSALAGLRALQTETGDTFDGNLSWAPYLITLAGCILFAGLALSRAGKRSSQ
jgi:uncharacterized BrkB/YihY/UPF0761 family membrane protein